MTEVEWQLCQDPVAMINLLPGRESLSKRKLGLFGYACCRQIWQSIEPAWLRNALEACEKYADGMADEDTMSLLSQVSIANYRTAPSVDEQALSVAVYYACSTHMNWDRASTTAGNLRSLGETQRYQKALLHCIFGPLLFRSVIVDPRWRNVDVVALARGIYEERAFDRLPLLADALMDAGCADEMVLSHCRSEGPHVRGCWVVDLVLGKE